MDLATLGLAVDSRPVKEANDNLRTFQSAARGAQSSAEGYSQSADKAARATDKLSQSANGSLRVMSLLRTGLAAVGAAFSLKAIVDMADGWSDLTSRVNLAAGSIEKGSAVMERLSEIARRTYSSIAQTTESYIANASIMRELGYSTKQTLDYTAALNNALVVSGAKGQQAASVQNAMAKAMALGKLSGDNLNTVIATGGRLAELLAERFKTTTGGLLQLGQKGKITGDIIADVLLKNLERLNEEADSMPATIGDAFTLIGNSILRAVGVFDQANNISGTFAEMLIKVADNMDRLIVITGTAVTLYGTGYVAAFVAARLATMGLTGALSLLRAALVRTGIGAIAVALGEFVYQLIKARETSDSWGEAFALVATRMKTLMEGIQNVFLGLTDLMKSAWSESMASILQATQDTFGSIAGLFGATFTGFGEQIDSLREASKDFGAYSSIYFDEAGKKFADAFKEFQAANDNVDLSGDAGVAKKLAETSKEAERAARAYRDLIKSAKDRIQQLELEEQLVGKTGVAADTMRFKLELLQKAQDKGRTITAAQRAELEKLAEQYGAVAARVAELQMAEELRFQRAQMFRSPTEQRVYGDLRQAGIDPDSAAGQRLATQIRLNEQLQISKDLTKDFASSFVSDMLNGKSALEALTGALSKLADKLLDMALDSAINSLFGNLLGATGGGGGISSIFGGGGSDPWSGLRLFAKGGVTNKPAIFGDAGPEAAVPLPDGRSIPVRIYGEANSNQVSGAAQGVHVTVGWSRTADGNLKPFVEDVAQKTAAPMINEGISQYDSQMLPGRVNEISQDPRAVGA
ncbi:tape measure domain-containing protein [Ochrobactrum sp. 19YEA23]|uniref:tape measure protein n=1 Tax=Ochrobactrum sp. 19YEA23 TaxID=3039854 RepID=UPI002479BAA6|nr:tape measure domain-containing protein [Ochrobactrum sp. 19YEA23]